MEKLSVFENELVPVYVTDKGEHVVDGRELWEVLQSKRQFANWIKDRLIECDATENQDYTSFNNSVKRENGGGTTKIEYIIKLDTAKEMAMLERNEIGKSVRKYFINVEKKVKKKLPSSYKEALQQLLAEIEEKEKLEAENAQKDQLIGELKPKADYTDLILQNDSVVAVTQISKDYGMSATMFNELLHELHIQYKVGGQWVLYSAYNCKSYTHSETVAYNEGKSTRMFTKWTQKGRLFLYNLLKENKILPLIEQKEMQLTL